MRPDGPRPLVVGPDAGPAPPFPVKVSGPVIAGFGRGSKELGIPTANIPISGLSVGGHDDIDSGVYYGFCSLAPTAPSAGTKDASGPATIPPPTTYQMVMSIGWNPFYKNTVRSVEVHILYSFPEDFYGQYLRLLILGFVRPEYDYVDKESLIEDIRTDCKVAERSLERDGYRVLEGSGYLGGKED